MPKRKPNPDKSHVAHSVPEDPRAVDSKIERARREAGTDFDELTRVEYEISRRQCEALKLYEPTSWQKEFHKTDCKQRALIMGNQVGKAVRNGTLVATPSGLTPIENLKIGDKVIGGDGHPCRVTGVFPQGVLPLYRLTFDDGLEVDCCAEHQWLCRLGKQERFRGHPPRVRNTGEIITAIGPNPNPMDRASMPSLTNPGGGKWPSTIPPYALGVLLGDGSMKTSLQLTTADEEIVETVTRSLPRSMRINKLKNRYGYSLTGVEHGKNPWMDELRRLGLWGRRSEEKFIPDELVDCNPE